jgi:DNA (cytosine-5)-methyltransferase 1
MPPFQTIDLFAGPGGLAEGFSAVTDESGARAFNIALSVEKEHAAFATLRLRSFCRKFQTLPPEYYQYIGGNITLQQLRSAHEHEWLSACEETMQLELGTEHASGLLTPRLDAIRRKDGSRTILVGGPPCQAYSLAGRSRNRGIAGYTPEQDHRHYLYKEYIAILSRLAPACFVMENVKGFLSSQVAGAKIFDQVIGDLESAGGQPKSYRIVALSGALSGDSRDFIVRSEDYGIPQSRHRVILVGFRTDIVRFSDQDALDLKLAAVDEPLSVSSALADMPPLRSGLSRADDPKAWRNAAVAAFKDAAMACERGGEGLGKIATELHATGALIESTNPLPRSSCRPTPVRNPVLAQWLNDPSLRKLSLHESRSHMAGDLARYAFCAVFAAVVGRSPKSSEFPSALAPSHGNWETGNFADRFRVQRWGAPSSTITSHISKDGHYFIHPDPRQCRSLTVREAARLQTFPDNYHFEGNRTQQYVQVGNAVPPLLAFQIAKNVHSFLARYATFS